MVGEHLLEPGGQLGPRAAGVLGGEEPGPGHLGERRGVQRVIGEQVDAGRHVLAGQASRGGPGIGDAELAGIPLFATGGMIIWSTWVGEPVTPSIRGTEKP